MLMIHRRVMRKLIKTISFWLLTLYTAYMFYRTPSISDSIIILALAGLYGFELYLIRLQDLDPVLDPEYQKLKEQYDLEALKLSVENTKMQQAKQAELAAARNSIGSHNEKRFSF